MPPSLQTRPSAYSREALLACAQGALFGHENAQLPTPPMMMIDRILHISNQKGMYGKGEIIAELDIDSKLWFFDCHFISDPVMPGCLGLDAMWQLVGFFLGWSGYPGKGRALGCGELKFRGQVLSNASLVRYHIHVKKIVVRSFSVCIADGFLSVDDKQIYAAKDLRVGVFSPKALKKLSESI